MNYKRVTYSPLALSSKFSVSAQDDLCLIQDERDEVSVSKFKIYANTLEISPSSLKEDNSHLLLLQIEYLLGSHNEVTTINIQDASYLPGAFEHLGHSFSRSEFFQLPVLWHINSEFQMTPEKWVTTNGRHHPRRTKFSSGTKYRRYMPQLDQTISFRTIEMSDLDTFHEWHNQPRVAEFWELQQSKEELKKYIEKSLTDLHQTPMIVEIDEEPVGYYEMYWVREDRLGPYYESDAFDRGFHFLIGNTKFLGRKTTDLIIKSGLHFLFLDDPRTRRIMAEPRHDNQKVLKYAEASIGWKNLKTFDFPHKTAVLLENSREIFFEGNSL